MKKIFICAMIAILMPFTFMLTGCFGNKSFNIDVKHVNHGSIYCDVSQAKKGEEVQLYYEEIETGYEFLYFTLNGKKLTGDTFTMPRKDVTVSAVISKKDYTITYHMDSKTSFVNPHGIMYYYTIGTTASLPDAQKPGYEFLGWYRDAQLNSKITSIEPFLHENLDLYPKFEVMTYYINYYNVEQATNNNPDSFDINSGTITLENAEKADYEFKGWYDNKNFTGNAITTIPGNKGENVNLYAKFISTKVDNDGYRYITSAIDFLEIVPQNLNGKYKFQGTIDFDGFEYIPIGTSSNPFTGEIKYVNGLVSNLTINTDGNYVGLFGYIKNATIKGVSIIDVEIKKTSAMGFDQYVGALAGYVDNSTLDDIFISYVDIDVRVWNGYIGSLVGFVKDSTITKCEVAGSPMNVVATQTIYAGGMLGKASVSTMSRCSVDYGYEVNVNLESQTQNGKIYFGGLVGESYKTDVANSYVWQVCSEVEISLFGKNGASYVGGLVGYLGYASVSNSYAKLSKITCNNKYSLNVSDVDMYLGGLVGKASYEANIANSFVTTYKDRAYALVLSLR